MDQTAEIRDDAVAIFDTPFAGHMFENVVNMEATQQIYHGLRGEAGLEDPMSQV